MLNIEPGAELSMGPGTRIIVYGRIVAIGTEDEPIKFVGVRGRWRGIVLKGNEPAPFNDTVPIPKRMNISPFTSPMWETELTWRDVSNSEVIIPADFVTRIQKGNIFRHCRFENAGYGDRCCQAWYVIGHNVPAYHRAVVEAERTSFVLSDSEFSKASYMGNVLYNKSYAAIFDTKMAEKCSQINIRSLFSVGVIDGNEIIQQPPTEKFISGEEGIYPLSSVTLISNNKIIGRQDDCLDIKSGVAVIANNDIRDCKKYGLNLIADAMAFTHDNTIEGMGQAGIAVRASTEVFSLRDRITKNNIGIFGTGDWFWRDVYPLIDEQRIPNRVFAAHTQVLGNTKNLDLRSDTQLSERDSAIQETKAEQRGEGNRLPEILPVDSAGLREFAYEKAARTYSAFTDELRTAISELAQSSY